MRNERGVLGRLAAEVTAADANIVHVSMHDDAGATVSLHLTIQVDTLKHLSKVMRAIRHVPQVQTIVRVKG
jgi:(p)ppGpp synthase/HD superfamily hydrolase